MKKNTHKIFKNLNHYAVFFLLVAFVITCCMSLFISVIAYSMNITLTDHDIAFAAKLTFVNVIFISLIITVIDSVRRKLTVDIPVQRIIEGADRMMAGDFSVRIPPHKTIDPEDRFNEIIDCMNKMAEELSGIETLRTDFIANVSHELKTPLAVIQNYGTMLQQPGLTDEQRNEYAKTITETSRRLAALITNILKLNKLENQQIFPEAKVYNVSEQLCECMLNFENLWEKKQLLITTDIEEDIFVKTDEEMMSLVWNNLISNAIKFTEPGGTIGLVVKSDEVRVVVQISDTGCGISPEVGKHIFDKFYQGDTSHATKGNGLGLALVKRVIDITGSTIEVKSALGKGTTFTVVLQKVSYEDKGLKGEYK